MLTPSSQYAPAIVRGPCDRIHAARVKFGFDVLVSSNFASSAGYCGIHALIPASSLQEIRESGLDVRIMLPDDDD